MTSIQIMFFCILTTVLIASEFVLLWQMHRMKIKIDKTTKLYDENVEKLKGLCNKIYDKLKEVVEKVNPLIAESENRKHQGNSDAQDAVFVEQE